MMGRFLIIAACIVLGSIQLIAEESSDRGLKTVVERLDQNAKVGRQYLFLIGIDKYRSWPPLQRPVEDAKDIRDILTSTYFIDEVFELYDEQATKANILKKLDELKNALRTNDSLLIFYAGHGALDKKTNMGFWIPVNAGTDEFEQAHWLPNLQIKGIIANFQAIHICLISDSCFSGDFITSGTRGADGVRISEDYFRNAYARVSRQVLASSMDLGLDKSPFTLQLKIALRKNASPYLDPLMLYNDIRLGVWPQVPLFGNLKDSGHQDGASFLLFHKAAAAAQSGQDSDKTVTTVTRKDAVTTSTSETKTKPEEKSGNVIADTATNPSAGLRGPDGFAIELGCGMTFPVLEVADVIASGYNPVLAFKYRFETAAGTIGLGLMTGAQIETTASGFAWSYSLVSIPLAVHLTYETAFMLPFFVTVEADGGGVASFVQFNEPSPDVSDTFTIRPFVAAGIGVGYRLSKNMSVAATGNFIVIMFDGTIYTSIAPTLKLGIDY